MPEVTVPDEFAEFLGEEVASGKFRSQSEAVAEGLRLLQARERKRDALVADLFVGIDQLDRGAGLNITTPEDQQAYIERIIGQAG